jgi:hypothetical protein
MMAATAVMKQGPSRIGSISKDIKLPRTILFKTFISVIIWGVLGMMIGAIFRSFTSVLYGGIIFGIIAYFATTFSPLKGESLSKFLGLTLKAQRQRKFVNGKLVRTYVGLTPITRPAAGRTLLLPGAVNVSKLNFDERGVAVVRRKTSFNKSHDINSV